MHLVGFIIRRFPHIDSTQSCYLPGPFIFPELNANNFEGIVELGSSSLRNFLHPHALPRSNKLSVSIILFSNQLYRCQAIEVG